MSGSVTISNHMRKAVEQIVDIVSLRHMTARPQYWRWRCSTAYGFRTHRTFSFFICAVDASHYATLRRHWGQWTANWKRWAKKRPRFETPSRRFTAVLGKSRKTQICVQAEFWTRKLYNTKAVEPAGLLSLFFPVLTDVHYALGRHVVQQFVHQSVFLFVQFVLRNPDVEQLQVTHVAPATQTWHVSKLWPLVLPVKVGRWALKKAGWWEVDCWECAAEGRNGVAGLSFAIGGQNYGEVLIALGGLRFGRNCEAYFGEGCKRSVQWGDFGQHLSTYCTTEESHGRPWSSWPAVGPS